MSEKGLPDRAVEVWNQFKKDQPGLALALSVLPVTGQITAATEYYDAMQKGDIAGGVEAAVQFGLGSAGAKAGKALMTAGEQAYTLARNGITTGRFLAQTGGDVSAAAKLYSAEKSAAGLVSKSGVGAVAGAESLSALLNMKEQQGFNEGLTQ